jgi:hypothetical protein
MSREPAMSNRASRSASSWQCTWPFCSFQGGVPPSPKASHRPPTSQIWIPVTSVFPKAKIANKRMGICECDGHTVHKLSHQHLTAYWLAPRESDCSGMHRKVSSDWLPSYIKATWLFLMVFSVAGYFLDRPCIYLLQFSGCGLTSLTLCSLLAGYLCFGRSCCLFHQLRCYWCGNLVSLRTKSRREMASKVFPPVLRIWLISHVLAPWLFIMTKFLCCLLSSWRWQYLSETEISM